LIRKGLEGKYADPNNDNLIPTTPMLAPFKGRINSWKREGKATFNP
jgi:hypothetical protein